MVPNTEQGLDAIRDTIWGPPYQQRQRELLWWLHEHLVQEHLPDAENLRRMEEHLGLALR